MFDIRLMDGNRSDCRTGKETIAGPRDSREVWLGDRPNACTGLTARGTFKKTVPVRGGACPYRCRQVRPGLRPPEKENPDGSDSTATADRRRIALTALFGSAALHVAPLALTTPMAGAESLATRCAKGGGTLGNGHLYEACTTTDKNGDKTKSSYVDGKAQGCIAVPLRKPKFNLDPSVVAPVTETPATGGSGRYPAARR